MNNEIKIRGIREKWCLKEHNKQASVDLWDSMAESFGAHEAPVFEENRFLQLLERYKMIDSEFRILDVGCGAGRYSLALAGRCSEVIGADLSPKMVELARAKATQDKSSNVTFSCMDWHQTDLQEAGFEKSFDLVIARMTPAIQSADTFLKLSQASRNWCVLSKPTRRTDPVSDEIKRLAGIQEKRESSDAEMLYAIELLWLMGLDPQIEYEHQYWNMEKTLKEAYGLYINRVKTYGEIPLAKEMELKEYLNSIAREGMVYENVETTIATLYWQV